MNRIALTSLALVAALAAPPLAAAGPGRPADLPCDGLSTYLASLPVEPLSDAEKEGLLFTREEEKLARDVYVAMAAKWGDSRLHEHRRRRAAAHGRRRLPPRSLRAGRPGRRPGARSVSRTMRLAALYVSLVEKGNVSLVDALAVGATIEDLDLADVERLLEAADNADVDTLMQNLAKGSRNHLRLFTLLLDAAGVVYVPQFLDAAEYEEIVATPPERHVVYDAAGVPVKGIPAGPCDGAGPGAGSGPSNGAGRGGRN